MRVDQKLSGDVIDLRRAKGVALIAGFFAALFGAVIGRHTVSTYDPDRGLLFIVSSALDRAQDFWDAQVPGYRRAKVVVFERETSSACGRALSSTGPFYCEEDGRIYVDLGFLRAIDGDLGQAIVIGHELGHHVQKLRGELGAARSSMDVELEADCYAGAWVRAEREAGRLDVGDVDEALRSVAAVGDDRICPACSPEHWGHGSSSQRLGAVQAGLAGLDCRS